MSDEGRESKLVSMRFRPETVDRVRFLQKVTGVENRTQITAEAIALAKWWVKKKKEGAKVYAEYPDGERESVVIPGLEPSTADYGQLGPEIQTEQR
jgi:hypothetical protein